MHLKQLIAALAITLSGMAVAADKHDHAHAHTSLHGGIVVEANDLDFELVAKPDALTLHIRDHGKPIDTKGVSGKVTILSGSQKVQATLVPAGDSRLESKGTFPTEAGTKIVATVNLGQGRTTNVRFALK